jgi:hypothetical protein
MDRDYGAVASVAPGEDQPTVKKTEALKDYIAELKEELQDAEERLKELEK